jgi:hypothetical protein
MTCDTCGTDITNGGSVSYFDKDKEARNQCLGCFSGGNSLCVNWPDDDDDGQLRPAADAELTTPSGRQPYNLVLEVE